MNKVQMNSLRQSTVVLANMGEVAARALKQMAGGPIAQSFDLENEMQVKEIYALVISRTLAKVADKSK